ncbi:hypothetical protein [Paenibacillus sp. HJGM_3]|uniref:hypothetical protein n=1 Tax=Paenibacillus sp. HJGM_3 TaxID=3379816 RepID=UPI00385D5D19
MSPNRAKVSQNTAILIEAARTSGMSDDELIRLASAGSPEPFASIAPGELEFGNLIDYAATQPESFERAVREGYQITFNTINGMKYYIGIRFGRMRERDYPNLPDRIEGLMLSLSDASRLRESLSPFWTVEETGRDDAQGTVTLRIYLPATGSGAE